MKKNSSRRGFTLIEVVVSIFVVGMVVIASTSLLHGTRLNQLTRDQDLALKVANNEIAALRAGGYDALPADGPFASTDLSSLRSGTGSITVSDYNPKTKKVDVSVTWLDQDDAAHTIALSTLITEAGGL